MALPASIRHRNPGAMGLGASARKFGARNQSTLSDGESNGIALFPTSVDGAAAQFHLLASKTYFGMRVEDAIAKWSGVTNPKRRNGKQRLNAYLAELESETEWTREDYLDADILGQPETAVPFAKAMAQHEAGQPYPLGDTQWLDAYNKAFDKSAKVTKADKVPVDVLARYAAASNADLGQKEVPGKAANPRMVVWYAKAGHPEIRSDEVANCAAANCCWLEEAGCANPKTLLARDFLEYGTPISEPVENCIAVLWRVSPNSWQGHVGRVVKWSSTHVWLHGANQGNEVNVRAYPRSTVLGYRLPIPATRSVIEIATDTSVQRKTVGGGATLGVLLWSAWETVTGWSVYAYEGVGHMVGLLPETAATVSTTVASGRVITESAGMPWPMQLTLLIAVCAICGGLYATYKRLRTVNPWAVQS